MHTEINFDGIQTFGLVLKKINDLFCISFGKIEVSLWKYHILMEFKAYNVSTWISIPSNNLGWFIQKISITYRVGQNCWDKTENLFFIEKNPLPPSQGCLESFRRLRTKLGQIEHWHRGVSKRNWNLKN